MLEGGGDAHPKKNFLELRGKYGNLLVPEVCSSDTYILYSCCFLDLMQVPRNLF